MARLGELLVGSRLLTADQVDQALRAQVIWGGRIGTNLVELGLLDLDELSSALGRQHRLPAALARHFERADAALQQRLSPDLAERFACVPIATTPSTSSGTTARRVDNIVVAVIDPLDDAAKLLIAGELGVAPNHLVVSIAAELRIRYHLERVYRIPRPARFLRARGKTNPKFAFSEAPDIDSETEVPVLQASDDLAVPITHLGGDTAPMSRPHLRPESEPESEPASDRDDLRDTQVVPRIVDEPADATPQEIPRADTLDEHLVTSEDDAGVPVAIAPDPTKDRRRYIRTLADEPSTESERAALGRIQIRKVARRELAPTDAPADTMAEATRQIRRGGSRDKVADMTIDAIERFVDVCDAALLMVVRGDVAIGWRGFARAGSSPPELAVPMESGLVPAAIAKSTSMRRDAEDLDALDLLLFRALGGSDGDLVIVPVPIAGKVMCVIALATASDAAVSEVETIAAAAGAAFARLMRAAGR